MNAPTFDEPKLDLFCDSAGEWRWRLVAANGEIVAASEGYKGGEEAALEGGKAMLRNALTVAAKLLTVLLVAVVVAGCQFRIDRSASSGDVVDLRFPAPCDPVESTGGDIEGGGKSVGPPIVVKPTP